MLGVSGTLEVLPARDVSAPECIAAPLAAAIQAAAQAAGCKRIGEASEHIVLVPPEILTRIADAGCDWRAFHALLAERCEALQVPDSSAVHVVCAGGIGEKMTCLQPWGGTCLSVTRRV